MKYIIYSIIGLILIAGFAWLKSQPSKMQYKKGDIIKNYHLLQDNGGFLDTEKLKGSWLILYFYPKDDTPGCTKEAQTFTSLLTQFETENAKVYGVNTNSPESHRQFKEKYDLKVTLLTDKTESLMRDFSVKVIAGFCSRDTVLINPDGKLEEYYRGVNPAGHPGEILNYIKERNKQTR